MSAYRAFVGASYRSQSYVSDQEQLINWYVEKMESEGATAASALYPTPGVVTFATVSSSGCRGAFSYAGERAFVVFGASFIEVFSDGTSVVRGTMAVDGHPATITTNGDGGGQLFITSGDRGYCYDLLTDVFTEVLTSGAAQGGFLYGYFVAFDVAQSKIRLSNLFDGTTWDPTQFAQSSIQSDPWRAMFVTPYGQILLLGNQTGSFWVNTGAFPFPFAPDQAGLVEEGIAAPFSVQQAGKSTVWLSTNKNGGLQVQRAQGYNPERISNHALEYALSRYTRVDDAIGQTYEDQGHAFYLLTFPTAGKTWVFDFSTGLWHERGTWISEQTRYQAWRPQFHCSAFGKHLWGDRDTAHVYWSDIEFPLDVEGRPIRRLRRSPATNNEHERMFFERLELLMQTGNGTQLGQGQNPQVMLRVSNDFGQTWGPERDAGSGRIGQYYTRVFWSMLGSGRGRVYEVTVSDPVPWRITNAYQRVTPSREAA